MNPATSRNSGTSLNSEVIDHTARIVSREGPIGARTAACMEQDHRPAARPLRGTIGQPKPCHGGSGPNSTAARAPKTARRGSQGVRHRSSLSSRLSFRIVTLTT